LALGDSVESPGALFSLVCALFDEKPARSALYVAATRQIDTGDRREVGVDTVR
jgi:hypothetical protein